MAPKCFNPKLQPTDSSAGIIYIMQTPNHILNKFKERNLEDNTISNYVSCLRRYMGEEWDDLKVFEIEKIDLHTKLLPIKSKEAFLRAIMYAFESCYEQRHQKLRDFLCNARDESMILSIRKLNRSKEEKITYEEMQNRASLPQRNKINAIIAKLYTLEVPLRADTWSRVRVIDIEESNSSNKYNYLNLDTGLLYLNRYKTIKTYGKKTILLNELLLVYLRNNWYKDNIHINNPLKYLVPNRDGNKLSAHNFNLRLKTIFGYGSSVLRHSYISYRRKLGDSDDDMKKIAYRMNTSFRQICLTYDDTNSILERDESSGSY